MAMASQPAVPMPVAPVVNVELPSFTASCRTAWKSASASSSDPLVQQQAIEGATLRAVAAFVSYPVDVLKTQVQAGHPTYKNLRAAPRLIADYRTTIFRGYPGVGANSFLMGALMFGGYRFFDNFWKLQGVSDYWRPAVAGASIGAICGVAATPLEQVKTVMALQESWVREGKIQNRVFTSVPYGAVMGSWRLKFYAVLPLACRTALFDCQLFFYNSRLREYMANNGHKYSEGTRIFLGTFGFMLAGLLGATINYPFDLVKGRMMAEAHSATTGLSKGTGMLGTFSKVVGQGGLQGLFKGLPTRSALHAVVWCTVGVGRELCEWSGIREGAKARSAAAGHSKKLSA